MIPKWEEVYLNNLLVLNPPPTHTYKYMGKIEKLMLICYSYPEQQQKKFPKSTGTSYKRELASSVMTGDKREDGWFRRYCYCQLLLLIMPMMVVQTKQNVCHH